MLNWLLEEESGQGMVEYGLILVLVSIAAILGLTAIGGALEDKFQGLGDGLEKPEDLKKLHESGE